MLKQCAKSLLARFGYRITRNRAENGAVIDILKLAVAWRARVNRDFRFVQIGANDGLLDDPIVKMVKAWNLCGVLVEPMPDYFQRLQENYSGIKGVCFENCAVSDRDGTCSLYRFRSPESLHPLAAGHASLDRRHLVKQSRYMPGSEEQIEEIKVTALSLDSLFAKHSISCIDLLQVDTEGYDYEIVRMTMNTSVRPAIINYERVNLSVNQQYRCRTLLDSQGYAMMDHGGDTLAIRESEFQVLPETR